MTTPTTTHVVNTTTDLNNVSVDTTYTTTVGSALDTTYITYITGGNAGDVFHVLNVIRQRWTQRPTPPAILYVSEDAALGCCPFTLPLERTHHELAKLLEREPYIHKVCIHVSGTAPWKTQPINLNLWRCNVTGTWDDRLRRTYNVESPRPWLTRTRSAVPDTVVVHCARRRFNRAFPWQALLTHPSLHCVFVGSDREEYEYFPYNHLVEFKYAPTLCDMVDALSGASFVVGSMSMPAAMTWALGIPLVVALAPNEEEAYAVDHVYWFQDARMHNLQQFVQYFTTSTTMIPLYRTSQAAQDVFVWHMMGMKSNGTYLDIGCSDCADDIVISPSGNNTLGLFRVGWKGIGIDINPSWAWGWEHLREQPFLTADITTIDWEAVLTQYPELARDGVDYISFDVDDATAAAVAHFPWHRIRFTVLTIEHDSYCVGDTVKRDMRNMLSSAGYTLVASDVQLFHQGAPRAFEDWWVDKQKVDPRMIHYIGCDGMLGTAIARRLVALQRYLS
jgi:hypothetical protein